MSLPAMTVAFTAAFIQGAEPVNVIESDLSGLFESDGFSFTTLQLDKTPEHGEGIQLAQVNGEDIAKLIIACALRGLNPQECLAEAGRSTQQPIPLPDTGNTDRITRQGRERVADRTVSPNEIANARDVNYYGAVMNRQNREVALWDLPVTEFGPVCVGTVDLNANPLQTDMRIVSETRCSEEFSGRLINDDVGQVNPVTPTPQGFISYPGIDEIRNFSQAFGGDESYRFVGSVPLSTRSTYPVAVTGRRITDNETGCFEVDAANDTVYPRIPDEFCGDLDAPAAFR